MDWRPFFPVEEVLSKNSVGRGPISPGGRSSASTNRYSQSSSGGPARHNPTSAAWSRNLKLESPLDTKSANHGRKKDRTSSGAIPHPNFPTLPKAIHDLGTEIFNALNEYQALVQNFETAVNSIATWADTDTLDMIWINMIDKVSMKGKERQNKAEPVTTLRLVGCKQVLMCCLENMGAGPEYTVGWDAEDQVRMGNKLVVHCSGIIDLSRWTLNSYEACKYFVKELQEVMVILDPKSHKWINETSIKAGHSSGNEVSSFATSLPGKGWSGENDLTDTSAPRGSQDLGVLRKSFERNETPKDTGHTAVDGTPVREPSLKDVQEQAAISQSW